MSIVDLEAKIPNNVGLRDNKRLLMALEKWQPKFLDWWNNLGPTDFNKDQIYLRTAIGVGQGGWAHFDYVKMPDYRWGIFLADGPADRKIHFGDSLGQPAWNEVPGEFRNRLRRLIVTQGDTEPASVEQQRMLGMCAPSLYDLRNIYQVNVEEGRHLWAMVYLLHRYFGRDGREEAEALLERRSGDVDNPRILGAFNEKTPDWLSFFMFTMFTDRDGKYQLLSLAESGFDPLARTCKFMLTEEAHHMFVGETGILRVVERSCDLMKEFDTDDIFKHGGIPLTVIRKYMNFWYSSSLDLFGAEISTNAANFFSAGLKGRAHEERYFQDHKLADGTYRVSRVDGGKVVEEDVPVRNALNEVLRDSYVEDNARGVRKWARAIADRGIDFKLEMPSRRFNRKVGVFADMPFDPQGNLLTREEFEARKHEWLPTPEERAAVASLMKPVYERGKYAGWIKAPPRGINDQGIGFEYVKM